MRLNELTLIQAQAGLQDGQFSSVELTNSCLERIDERNGDLNAFITVCSENAMHSAEIADKIIRKGEGKSLTGIPFSVKDAICVQGVLSTGAAKILSNYKPSYDATVIKKIKEQDGVLVGKNNCDAFGHGASNENSMYGCVKNPHDLSKVAGGSSGGSAAAVADNMCIYSVAEDTGGSIRQPASFCGLVGLRPSYGRNSRYGIMPMASSLDTVGPIAKTVEDCAVIQQVMAGLDDSDATTVPDKVPDYLNEMKKSVAGLKVGIPREYFDLPGLDEEVRQAVENQIKELEKNEAEIVDISLPFTKYAIAAYYVLVPYEDSSNLARLDGIRYGCREAGDDLLNIYVESRASGFPEEIKRRIMIGTYALSAGYYDAYYKKAQTVRTLIKRDFDLAFKQVDVLITPTSPFAAFDIGGKINDTLAMYLADVFVSPAALAGVPALTIPVGKNSQGLPIGAQLIGARLNEGMLFRVGSKLEKCGS